MIDADEDGEREGLRDRVRKTIFLPSSPIRLRDQLRGREREYERTRETLAIPGRSAFIYGERGVGKSSLAWTAAQEFNSADEEPIRVACHGAITFPRLVAQIAKRMHDQRGTGKKVKQITELGLKTSHLSLMRRLESETDELPREIDVNDAVELLEALVPTGTSRAIIIDELDEAKDPVFRSNVAFFIKQLGDNQASLKFIFAGIAENVSDLLAHHESAQRCLATIKLERLPLNVLRDIVVEGFKQIGIRVKDPIAYRIATLSDGFAHFTHLISLKMALAVLGEGRIPTELSSSTILEDAIRSAVADSEAIVREMYDTAVQKYVSYEAVLWAVADHWELYRSTRQIYESYVRICKDLKQIGEHVEVGDKKKLTIMVNKLKGPAHGNALLSPKRRSWFKIRLSMLRGYCRMVAASKGIRVGRDYLGSAHDSSPPRFPPNWDAVPDKDDVEDIGLLDFEEFSSCCQHAVAPKRHATTRFEATVVEEDDGYRVTIVAQTAHSLTPIATNRLVDHGAATRDEAIKIVDELATQLLTELHPH